MTSVVEQSDANRLTEQMEHQGDVLEQRIGQREREGLECPLAAAQTDHA